MSLLNDVLRDLQTRGGIGMEPLTGLEPVAEAAPPRRRNFFMLSLLMVVAIASTLPLWRPLLNTSWPVIFSGPAVETNTAAQPQSAADDDSSRRAIVRDATPDPAPANNIIESDNAAPEIASLPTAAVALPEVNVRVADQSPPAIASSPQPTANILRRDDHDPKAVVTGVVTRGLQALRAHNLAAAEDYFLDALREDSGDSAVWGYLYSAQRSASKTAAAERTLQKGLVAAEEPAPLAKLYARMLLDRGEKQAAISTLQNHRPAMTDTEYDAFLAAMLQQQGQFAEAGTIYRQLLDSNQNSGSWWIGLAMSSDSLGDRADAMAAFQRALRADALKPALAMYARRRIAELQAND